MPIDVNPAPDTNPEDQETLRKVYQRQLDEYTQEYITAAKRLDSARAAFSDARVEFDDAARSEAMLAGKIDALRMLAARDGVQLD